MKKKLVFLIILFLGFSQISYSYEGMWIPLLIEKLNIKDMQERGFKLTAEDIYSVNQACLTNAVVLFGKGCTGEIISPDGLLLTNYHCGFSRVQSHSTLKNDFISEGFWAYSKEEELPNPGLTVSFLVRMDDVTNSVLSEEDSSLTYDLKELKIHQRIVNLVAKTIEGTGYEAEIKPFFFGKAYYMFVYQVYRDVRLVGAPPSSIGRFGGDTDNWVWPRHTGDFSLFRVYADSANNPADYSPTNIPYKPKKYLNLSTKEIKEGDFTMVLGYPAKTYEYLSSNDVKILTTQILPKKIEVREARMAYMKAAMDKSAEINLMYANKYAGTANAWKKWIGVVEGAKKFNTVAKKVAFEQQLTRWFQDNPIYNAKYGNVLQDFTRIYTRIEPYSIAVDFGQEAIFGTELIEYISDFVKLVNLGQNSALTVYKKTISDLINSTDYFFHYYYKPIDEQVFGKMLELYFKNVNPDFYPDFYKTIQTKYHGNYTEYAHQIFKKTIFTDKTKVLYLLSSYSYTDVKKIISDPMFKIYNSFGKIYSAKVYPVFNELDDSLQMLYPEYLEALMQMQPEKHFYPDANFTMRMTYGKVEGYSPADAIDYRYLTTLKGVMEKENPNVRDYEVPRRLKELYLHKDFGDYVIDDNIPVCFTASNHTSGGNSGSPVFNANGELIGLNFDRNWEGTLNDYMYDPAMCRNISLDVRYILFIIDKYAGAQNIIDELTIVN